MKKTAFSSISRRASLPGMRYKILYHNPYGGPYIVILSPLPIVLHLHSISVSVCVCRNQCNIDSMKMV